MALGDGRTARAAQQRNTPIAPAYRARVITPPAGHDDTLTVEAVDDPGHVDVVVEWPDRTPLPVHGDECLVIYDLKTEPWIVRWSRNIA